MHKVNFLNLMEDDKDLIVSFALDDPEFGVRSLTLLRTLFYEELLDEGIGIQYTAFPNPFSSRTNIQFVLPQESNTRVEIYTIDGRLVDTLFDEIAEANKEYQVEFVSSSNSNVVYVYRIVTDYGMEYGKLIPLRR